MSRLQELIQELCPDGVEYRALGEVADLVRGSGLQKKDFSETGVGCIHYGQIHTKFGAYTDEVLSHVPEELAQKLTLIHPGDVVVAVTSEDVSACCKAVAWVGNVDVVTGGHCVVMRHNLDPKYLAYCFQTDDFYVQKKRFAAGVKVTEMRTDKLARIRIPVPPIEVQREVVRILDEYTAAHDELVAQLEQEMALREQQLQIARNELLTFCERERVRLMCLDELILMKAGKHLPASKLSSVQDDRHPYPCYGGNGLRGYTDTYNQDGARILIGRQGALCGNVKLATGKFYATEHAVVCNPQTSFDEGWLYHLLIHMDLNQYKTKSAQPGLAVSNIQHLMIHTPDIERQHWISSKLTDLDDTYNDLVSELKSEALLQVEQLTQTRNQLLSFPEKVA